MLEFIAGMEALLLDFVAGVETLLLESGIWKGTLLPD